VGGGEGGSSCPSSFLILNIIIRSSPMFKGKKQLHAIANTRFASAVLEQLQESSHLDHAI
jgi:hypothetical protein